MARLRILVIDDNELLRATIRGTLVRAGYDVREAGDGAAGLQAFRDHGADLVLTDTFMPGRDGLEVIRGLRDAVPRPKVVAMSGGGAMGTEDVLIVAQALGADGTLPKPFTPQDLLAAVRAALG